jgi:hypothetical protein
VTIRRLRSGDEAAVPAAGALVDAPPVPEATRRFLWRPRRCCGMWVGTERGNDAARRTYARAGGRETPVAVVVEWRF